MRRCCGGTTALQTCTTSLHRQSQDPSPTYIQQLQGLQVPQRAALPVTLGLSLAGWCLHDDAGPGGCVRVAKQATTAQDGAVHGRPHRGLPTSTKHLRSSDLPPVSYCARCCLLE